MTSRRILLLFAIAGLSLSTLEPAGQGVPGAPAFRQEISFQGHWQHQWQLRPEQIFQISVGIPTPSSLPPNGRIEVGWSGPDLSDLIFDSERGDLHTAASTGWTKTLHALDPDLHLVYKVPRSGLYTLSLTTVTERSQPPGKIWRDTGLAPQATLLPTRTPSIDKLPIRVSITPIPRTSKGDLLLEAEPNNTPEQAILVPFEDTHLDQVIRVVGGADDLEYYNNTHSGGSPDDWFRIEYRGRQPRILTANLQLVEPIVSARMRVYRSGVPTAKELESVEAPDSRKLGNNAQVPYVHPPVEVIPGPVPVYSYYQGRDINERIHQQDRNFRSFVTRELEPNEVYFLRVEANQPAYELELRLLEPAPYQDPRRALRQAIYYHLAEVDAWLIHRPRNIALHRRVRDGTSLFGENCMSCHTQAGVWGVADAFRNGYRPEGTVQNWRRLVNTMYESLRPTVKLEDGAVNTSLPPNDLGDGPAGSRVAGRNIVLHERAFRPKKLHAYQQRRTANYVLQTDDPKGINAASRGSNFGPNVVFKFAAEILHRSWKDTSEPKYFFGLEQKAQAIVATGDDKIKVSDDLGHRIEFFYRLWPADYPNLIGRLTEDPERVRGAEEFQKQFQMQIERDLQRLLSLQQEDGSWGFEPGTTQDEGMTWTRLQETGAPAPTAVALIALHATGRSAQDPVVKQAVDWILSQQFPYGLWNKEAQTGFVTTAYVIRALGQLFPEVRVRPSRKELEASPGEDFLDTLSRLQRLQTTGDGNLARLMIDEADSSHPQIRYYALLGLGGALAPGGLPTLIAHLDDPVKACREAAFWSLRQLLLDGVGWEETFRAFDSGSELARQSIQQALVSRADLVGPGSTVGSELARVLSAGMQDPFAGVRAWAHKAAWHWWVWNPPLRDAINQSWIESLLREENEGLAEMALRYSTASFLIVNGQVANQTGGEHEDQQYPALARFYEEIARRRGAAEQEARERLDRRLTAVAATHFQERAGDGGPGQLGYSTPGSSEVVGRSILSTYHLGTNESAIPWDKLALEAAANTSYSPLQQEMLDLFATGNLDLVAAAARALSNPRALSLSASVTTLRPFLAKLEAFLEGDRPDDAQALSNFLARVQWSFEGLDARSEAEFYRLLIPEAKTSNPPPSPAPGTLFRPALGQELENAGTTEELKHTLLGQILGENPTLQRKVAFDFVGHIPRFWLPSTEWMLRFQERDLSQEGALAGAIEAEDLELVEITAGRTTEQIVPDGLASKNTLLWWREGLPGASVTFAIPAEKSGPHELMAAFLHDRDGGTVAIALNGKTLVEQMDGYRPEQTPTGPVSLGIHPFQEGENLLTIRMLGSHPEAEPLYIFGLDYLKAVPEPTRSSILTQDEQGIVAVDPLTHSKQQIIEMFGSWFSTRTREEDREKVISLANKTALRRNPLIRSKLATYVAKETVPTLRERIQNILNSDDEVYGEELHKLIVSLSEGEAKRGPRIEASSEFIQDILHFRDQVFSEMTRVDDRDGRACISCHGVPGRVPTLYLNPPDAAGYIAPAELLVNYRKMQERVNLDQVEESRFLRKPLNIQTPEEEGHQGGQRYEPDDAGYQTIRSWVLQQLELQKEP